jgi:uncharacterized membrane protein
MNRNSDNYKWGFFYFNPKDPRVIVPKAIRWMGWTLNFARPEAYIIIIAFIFVVVLTTRFA